MVGWESSVSIIRLHAGEMTSILYSGCFFNLRTHSDM